MFYKIMLVLLILDAILLVAAVLLQSGKGGGLAASFGGASSSGDALFGTRQAGNLLTQASWWCVGIFIGLSFILQLANTRGKVPTSVLDRSFQQPAKAAAPPATPAPAGAPATAPAVPLQAVPTPDTKQAAPAPAPAKKP
jgi:preprotein translocase subunit SecG